MNARKFSLTLLSIVFSLLAISYQYSYIQYSVDSNLVPKDSVFQAAMGLHLLAWGGVAYVHSDKTNIVLACGLIAITNVYVMYQDYLYTTKQIVVPYKITTDYVLGLNFAGWMFLAYVISDNEAETRQTLFVGFCLFLFSTFGLNKERELLLTDGPSYILLTLLVVFLSYYLADIKKAKSPKPTPASPKPTPASPKPTPASPFI